MATNTDPMLTRKEAADYIGLRLNTLAIWASRKTPGSPAFIKMGKSVRYRQSELDRWLEANTVRPEE